MTWQAERAKTKAPRVPRLVIPAGAVCHYCAHPRSSHSVLVIEATCKAKGCDCPSFNPLCGCGHLLDGHQWGTPPNPWGCAFCVCKRFGAAPEGAVAQRLDLARTVQTAPPKPAPKPVDETCETRGQNDQRLRWGRRGLALYDCARPGCTDLATYWTRLTYYRRSGQQVSTNAYYCGPHFRRWWAKHGPSEQLSLF